MAKSSGISNPNKIAVGQSIKVPEKPAQVASLNELKAETLGSYIKKASASRKKSLKGSKADIKTWGKRQKGITTAVKQLTKEAGNQDDDWLHNTPFGLGEAGDKPDLALQKETTMENQNDLINEAIVNIAEENLSEMKENFLTVLQEKVIGKLEERKKQIASDYFAQ